MSWSCDRLELIWRSLFSSPDCFCPPKDLSHHGVRIIGRNFITVFQKEESKKGIHSVKPPHSVDLGGMKEKEKDEEKQSKKPLIQLRSNAGMYTTS